MLPVQEGHVFGQLESLALERVLFAADEIDPPDFARALESLKKVSALLLRGMNLSDPDEAVETLKS